MDIDNLNKQAPKVDTFLTNVKMLFKKHWGIMLFLVFLFGTYKFIVLVGEEMDKPQPVQEQIEYYEDTLNVAPEEEVPVDEIVE
jgi:Fe2+ transport system protein B